MVCTANHMYVHGYKKLGIFCQVFNVLQVVRLLATRGHYSIDMIIFLVHCRLCQQPSWTNGALLFQGKEYGRGHARECDSGLETFSGVSDVMRERRVSTMVKKQDPEKVLRDTMEDEGIADEIMVESTSRNGSHIGKHNILLVQYSTPSDNKNKKDR